MNSKLIVSESGRDRVHELCDDVTVVGTGIDANLLVRQPGVAPAHCEIKRTDAGFKLVDLETAAGTMVNGALVNQHLLTNGDTIQLGDARITYLGESATPARKARAAPPPPLTTLPLNEEGQPRRFYRHEGQRGVGTAIKASLIIAGLSVLVLILVWMDRTVPNQEGLLRYREARAILEKGDEASLRQGIAILEELPAGTLDERILDDVKERAKERLFELTQSRVDEQADREFQRITSYNRSNPGDLAYIERETRGFEARFPTHPLITKLEELVRVARAGGPEKMKVYDELRAAVAENLRQARYKDAFAGLALLEADPDFARSNPGEIGVFRSTVERAFEAHFTAQKQRAIDLIDSGNAERAIEILESLADVGVEPFSSQAKLLLTRLR
jgi:pSer/pThr/pTyr-binding forkhead associated (FHA) protein